MKISELEQRPIGSLVPYARNARTHSPSQIEQIAASIREFGWTNPVLIDDDGGIVAGHGRVMAARKLGMISVPVLELSSLTPEQRRAYIIADNKLAEAAGWANDQLVLELGDLLSDGFDLSTLGFSAAELNRLLAPTAGLTDENTSPDLQAEAISRPGDVWALGAHRLICGDSTDMRIVSRLLVGVRPHLMVTDPPYGVTYDPRWRLEAGVNMPWQKRAEGKVENDQRIDWSAAWALFPGEVAYVWHAGRYAAEVQRSLEFCRFDIRSQIIWAKTSLVIGRGNYHWQHEPCWYAVRQGAAGHWSGDRKQSTLWQIASMHPTQGDVDDGKTDHSTQKPVECMRRPIENNSMPGQAVYDPFVGSGTTIIACEQRDRCCFAIELNPTYVDLCVRRWQAYTGERATLGADGPTFEDVALERRPAAEVA